MGVGGGGVSEEEDGRPVAIMCPTRAAGRSGSRGRNAAPAFQMARMAVMAVAPGVQVDADDVAVAGAGPARRRASAVL